MQINDFWNCTNSTRKATDPNYKTHNGCNVECSTLLTEMNEDVRCIKQLYKEKHQSYDFSYAWKKYCKNKELTPHIKGCNLDGYPNKCVYPPSPGDKCVYLCKDNKSIGYLCCKSMDEVIFDENVIVSTCIKIPLNSSNLVKGKKPTLHTSPKIT